MHTSTKVKLLSLLAGVTLPSCTTTPHTYQGQRAENPRQASMPAGYREAYQRERRPTGYQSGSFNVYRNGYSGNRSWRSFDPNSPVQSFDYNFGSGGYFSSSARYRTPAGDFYLRTGPNGPSVSWGGFTY